MADNVVVTTEDEVVIGRSRVTVKGEDLRGNALKGNMKGPDGKDVVVGGKELVVSVEGKGKPLIALGGSTASSITVNAEKDASPTVVSIPRLDGKNPPKITFGGEGTVNLVAAAGGPRIVQGLKVAMPAPPPPPKKPLPIVGKGGMRFQPMPAPPQPTPIVFEVDGDASALGVTAVFNGKDVIVSSNARLTENKDGSITFEAISPKGSITPLVTVEKGSKISLVYSDPPGFDAAKATTMMTIDTTKPFADTEKAFKKKQQEVLDAAAKAIEKDMNGRDFKGAEKPKVKTRIMSDALGRGEGIDPDMEMALVSAGAMPVSLQLAGSTPEGKGMSVRASAARPVAERDTDVSEGRSA